MPRVVHFEIVSESPQTAIRFYESLFGWQFTTVPGHDDYWHIRTGPDDEKGINGGLTRPYFDAPGDGVKSFLCTIEVASIDAHMERIVAAGGSIAVPKFPIANVGCMLHARDPDGNLFGLIQKTGG